MFTYFAERFDAEDRSALDRYFSAEDRGVTLVEGLAEPWATRLVAEAVSTPSSTRRVFLDRFRFLADQAPSSPESTTDSSEEYLGEYLVAAAANMHVVVEQLSVFAIAQVAMALDGVHLLFAPEVYPFEHRHSGRFRFARPTEVTMSPAGAAYIGVTDHLFNTYADLLIAESDALRATAGLRQISDDFHRRATIRRAAQSSARQVLPLSATMSVGLIGPAQRIAVGANAMANSDNGEVALLGAELQRLFQPEVEREFALDRDEPSADRSIDPPKVNIVHSTRRGPTDRVLLTRVRTSRSVANGPEPVEIEVVADYATLLDILAHRLGRLIHLEVLADAAPWQVPFSDPDAAIPSEAAVAEANGLAGRLTDDGVGDATPYAATFGSRVGFTLLLDTARHEHLAEWDFSDETPAFPPRASGVWDLVANVQRALRLKGEQAAASVGDGRRKPQP